MVTWASCDGPLGFTEGFPPPSLRYSRSISKPIADSHAGVASVRKRRLLVIPFRPEAASHELWELDINAGEARRLTHPDATPFKIANGDWSVSPDGRHVAFLDSRDRNIWLLTLVD